MEIQKNVTLNASITAKVDESETNVVNMYANIPQQGQQTVSKPDCYDTCYKKCKR